MGSERPQLRIEALDKRYGARSVLAGVSLALEAGEWCAVTGASGAGKSTLLRLVAGLEVPDAGHIEICGRRASETRRVLLPPHARGLGFLFQSAALWPHLTVAENIGYGLDAPRVERDRRVAQLLAAAGLAGHERRRVDGLSGGEARRVALLRALAPRPALLLLDEPLAHLDPDSAARVRQLIEQETADFHPTVLVTAHGPAVFPGAGQTLSLGARPEAV
ncbi:MAG: ATP-binding cassette domain-containing protein [Vicinamibacteria bacterium]|nr:ATP-binding cassette domain-containing protein [Vicinamibacteria bacterium]